MVLSINLLFHLYVNVKCEIHEWEFDRMYLEPTTTETTTDLVFC